MRKNGILSVLFALFVSTLSAQVTINRGPYLQLMTDNSIVIKWRTDNPTESRVIYGTSPTGLTQTASDNTQRTNHELQITNLQPNTIYYYSVGNTANILSSGPDQYFTTHSPIGTERPYTFWVIGDCGTGNNDQRAVRDAYLSYMVGKPHADGIIMLGDNAYDFGFDGEYQDALFNNMYEPIITNTVMWPCPGNHDYYGGADASTQTGPYYEIFALPSAGQNGGYPSGTEAYYSFDIGNVHFISIDSYDSPRDSSGAQGSWLKLDLAQNTQEWTVVYWHHAPYTKGSHDSDNPFPWLDGELPEMRENFLPILERYGVDLVLCGHSHSYERSYLVDGHYGSSGSLTQNMILDNSAGDFSADCPYQKNTAITKSHKGTVYVVAGTSGKKSGTSSGWPHPVMQNSTTAYYGSMILNVDKNRLDGKFLTSTNQVHDSFTIIKNAGGKQLVSMCKGDTISLLPSFPADQYQWFPGSSTQLSLEISPAFSTIYYGQDPMGCIKDTFQVTVIQPGSTNPDSCATFTGIPTLEDLGASLYPNPVSLQEELVVDLTNIVADEIQIELSDALGRIIYSTVKPGEQLFSLPLAGMGISSGTYYLRLHIAQRTYYQKLIITQ